MSKENGQERGKENPDAFSPQLILEAPNYLAIHQPHRISDVYVYNQTLIKRMLDKIIGSTSQSLGNDPSARVVFCFEQGGFSNEQQRDFTQLLSETVQGSEGKGLDEEDFMRALRNQADGDPDTSYNTALFDTFFTIRKRFNAETGRKKVVGLVERAPLATMSLKKYSRVMESPQSSPDELLRMLAKNIGYMIARDTRYAQQIIDERRKVPNSHFIVVRGGAHVGLVNGLYVLSGGDFPSVDISIPRNIAVRKLSVLSLPLLWNRSFWAQVLGENKITLESARREDMLMTLSKNIGNSIQRDSSSYADWLRSRVAQYTPITNERINITLTQSL